MGPGQADVSLQNIFQVEPKKAGNKHDGTKAGVGCTVNKRSWYHLAADQLRQRFYDCASLIKLLLKQKNTIVFFIIKIAVERPRMMVTNRWFMLLSKAKNFI